MSEGYVFDHTAVGLLGSGNQMVSFLVFSAHNRADRCLYVPALCLVAAEADRPGTRDHVALLPAVEVTELDFVAVSPVGRLIRSGVDWRIAHAIVSGQPTVEWPKGRPVVTAIPEAYDGHQITTIHLKG